VAKAAELDKWNKMPPQEKQKALNTLPPERRKVMEDRLKTYNQLSPAEKQKLRQQYNAFHQLPPAKQQKLRQTYKEFELLPPDRREQLRGELQQLGKMDSAARRKRMSTRDFRARHTLSEQKVMDNLLNTVYNQ